LKKEDVIPLTLHAPRNVFVTNHPVLLHKLSLLRDKNTSSRDFRSLLRETTFYLGYEATADLPLTPTSKSTSTNDFVGAKLAAKVALIPIMRGGLGMVEPMLELLPMAAVHHMGMYRSRPSPVPVQYYNRLPRHRAADIAVVLDPCLDTAVTITAVCSILKNWGAKCIKVVTCVGSRPGLKKLLDRHPNVEVYVGAIDENLSECGQWTVPGIGDAGNRLYSTGEELEGEVEVTNCENGGTSESSTKRARVEEA